MRQNKWITVEGVVRRGHRVASGPSAAYPDYGSIEKQKPLFKELGLDLDRMFDGTLNVDIRPFEFHLSNPRHTFENLAWTDLTEPETFSFSACRIRHQETEVNAWVYYPHPETKKQHFQSNSTIEILSPPIAGMAYGAAVELSLNADEVSVSRRGGD